MLGLLLLACSSVFVTSCRPAIRTCYKPSPELNRDTTSVIEKPDLNSNSSDT